ncbi:Small GTPase superfamily, ARF/SAR type like protein [Aduncisulcus paluster]|uniref:Small GTPase superfamily, ARF/SAR type like protein n=1 Tax=Aduncisulcus paluster TaxID=2918883 RepID=A0ABQ5JYI8_9EUKA|nr:Small GTPase superfamily, ARF/SAR type like protein [Aduncisulcus paluster]
MGPAASKSEKKVYKILIIGLYRSGKTTTLMSLMGLITGKTVDFSKIPSTLGQNVAKLKLFKQNVEIFDMGGQDQYREHWDIHYHNTDGVVFVLDGADEGRFDEARHVFLDVFQCAPFRDTPILFLINKSDLDYCSTLESVIEYFDLEPFSSGGRKFRVLRVSALNGHGIYTAFQWLVKNMGTKK